MAEREAARLEKEKARRAALKKCTEEETAARKAEQEARERRVESKKRLLIERKSGRTSFLGKNKQQGRKTFASRKLHARRKDSG